MAAYLIVHRRDINDPDRLKEYRNGVNDTIAKYDGKVVVRADGFEVLEGHWNAGRHHDDFRAGARDRAAVSGHAASAKLVRFARVRGAQAHSPVGGRLRRRRGRRAVEHLPLTRNRPRIALAHRTKKT